jgi:hypothetical protein
MPKYGCWNWAKSYDKCARNDIDSMEGGCLGAVSATNYTSELAELDKLNVIRMSVGVGNKTDVSHGSALWMIDNSPDDSDPLQIDSADDLKTILTNLCVPERTDAPTESPTSKPTATPTKSPTPEPTADPTKSPTPAPIAFNGPNPGYTPYSGPSTSQPIGGNGGNPLVIGEQNCTDISFGLTNTWGTSIDYIFVQYKDLQTGIMVCEAFKSVATTWFEEFSAKCRRHAPISIVTITAVDSSFSAGDTASLLDCCGDNEILGELSGTTQKVVTSTYVLDCCPEEIA